MNKLTTKLSQILVSTAAMMILSCDSGGDNETTPSSPLAEGIFEVTGRSSQGGEYSSYTYTEVNRETRQVERDTLRVFRDVSADETTLFDGLYSLITDRKSTASSNFRYKLTGKSEVKSPGSQGEALCDNDDPIGTEYNLNLAIYFEHATEKAYIILEDGTRHEGTYNPTSRIFAFTIDYGQQIDAESPNVFSHEILTINGKLTSSRLFPAQATLVETITGRSLDLGTTTCTYNFESVLEIEKISEKQILNTKDYLFKARERNVVFGIRG